MFLNFVLSNLNDPFAAAQALIMLVRYKIAVPYCGL
jgi:hypothetical protein